MRTIVISAYPASGKTYMYSNYNGNPYIMLEADINKFKWTVDDKGHITNDINPDFPENYINYVKDNIGKVDVIFISYDKEMRDILSSRGIRYFLVYPDKQMKKDWVRRMMMQGKRGDFINYIIENFDASIDEIESNRTHSNVCKLRLTLSNPYLDNFIISKIDSDVKYSRYINKSAWDLSKDYKRKGLKRLIDLEKDITDAYTDAMVNRRPAVISIKQTKKILEIIKSVSNLYKR